MSKRLDMSDAQNCIAGSLADSDGGFCFKGMREGNSRYSITRSRNNLSDMAHWHMCSAKTTTQPSCTLLRSACAR